MGGVRGRVAGTRQGAVLLQAYDGVRQRTKPCMRHACGTWRRLPPHPTHLKVVPHACARVGRAGVGAAGAEAVARLWMGSGGGGARKEKAEGAGAGASGGSAVAVAGPPRPGALGSPWGRCVCVGGGAPPSTCRRHRPPPPQQRPRAEASGRTRTSRSCGPQNVSMRLLMRRRSLSSVTRPP